jgi:hypothetical protein
MHPYTTSGGGIATDKCYETITKDGTNTIVLMPNGEHIGLVGLENFTSRPGGRLALKPKAKRNRLDEKGGVNRDDNGVENGDGNGDDNGVENGDGNGDDNGVKNGGGNRDKKGGRRKK